MTTIGDVAQLAGVSRSTVSYALSGKRAISRATRERIESAIDELGYTPNAGARALATSQTMVIGLFVQFWDHTNAKARIGWLKYLLIRPQDHRLHHAAGACRAVNLGFIFSLWDRWFGTYVDADTIAEDYPLGLGERIGPKAVPRMLLGV